MSDAHAEHKNHSAVYAKVLGALLVLTVLTVLASSKAGVVDFGAWSFGVAMLIATAKALLVAL
ncbi:MAG: hypothetical protein KDD62_16545, partial [Bdellovibrionales bacterium]|nr:hypothetical protein [Bdellovibrionales bacterium]